MRVSEIAAAHGSSSPRPFCRRILGAHPEDELYDLESDPWEIRNVAANAENARVVSEMRTLLADWMIRTEDFRPVPLPRTIGRGG